MRATTESKPEQFDRAKDALEALRGRSGRIWFTSDTHFGHKGIVSRRPAYNTVEEMDEDIIRRWNLLVHQHDTVIHLGDVAFGNYTLSAALVRQLVGHKVLVKGNHDQWSLSRYRRMGFEHVLPNLRLGQLFLNHWPTRSLHAPEGCLAVLCGHVHEAWSVNGDCINVGVDVNNMQPVTLSDLSLDPSITRDP